MCYVFFEIYIYLQSHHFISVILVYFFDKDLKQNNFGSVLVDGNDNLVITVFKKVFVQIKSQQRIMSHV